MTAEAVGAPPRDLRNWTLTGAAGTPLALALIVLLGALIRFSGLDSGSLDGDEIASVKFAGVSLQHLWSDWMIRETNPPLFYTILHGWIRWFGSSDAAIRTPAALIGCAAIPLAYAIGKEVYSRMAGLIAALLAALWPNQLIYSLEARGYTLCVVGAMLAALGVLQITRRFTSDDPAPGGLRAAAPWLLYFVGCAIALYAHTTMVLMVVLTNVYFVWLWAFRTARRPSHLLAWVAVNALVVLAWSWWGWITFQQLRLPVNNVVWITRPGLYDLVNVTTLIYGPAGITFENSLLRVGLQVGGTGLLLLVALWGATRMKLEAAVLFGIIAVGAPALLFLISQKVPILLPRTLLWAEFSVLIGVAVGIAAIPSRALMAGLMALVIGLLVAGYRLPKYDEPWGATAAALNRLVGPDDVVVVQSTGVYLEHYCAIIGCRFQVVDVRGVADNYNRWMPSFLQMPKLMPSELPARLGGKTRIWSVRHNVDDDPAAALKPFARLEGPAPIDVQGNIGVTLWRPNPPATR